MKVLTVNVNGIEPAVQWGLFRWLSDVNADVVCLQNIQTKLHQLHPDFEYPPGYNAYYFDAEPDGYAGVALFCKETPKAIMTGMGFQSCDRFGRYIQADFEHVSVGSLLCPPIDSYNTQHERLRFLKAFAEHCNKTRRKRREFIFAGSYYVAPKPEDVQGGIQASDMGVTAEEQAIMANILGTEGFVDAFREANFGHNQFTWWPSVTDANQGTNGRRFDYQLCTPGLKGFIVDAKVLTDFRFGLHSPVLIEYEVEDLQEDQLSRL
jgi:exodeoxyribonuclease-3